MSTPIVFDVPTLRRHRQRRSASIKAVSFLLDEVTARLLDRLDDVRYAFGDILDLGSRHGVLGRALEARRLDARLVAGDPEPTLVADAPGHRVAHDLELLPFREAGFDAVISALSLHAVNDLPGTLIQVRRALRPDGLFMAAFVGGETLHELRDVLLTAELERTGGASPRVAPFVDVRDLGDLLRRTGFALPVADFDRITLTYADPFALLAELRQTGEANALVERSRTPLRRDVLLRAAELYRDRYSDARGRIRVTVDVLFATGWSPGPNQPQPAKRGSGTMRLADAMGVDPAILEGRVRPRQDDANAEDDDN